MINLKDITAEGERISEAMKMPSEVKEKVMDLLSQASEMISSEGLDPMSAINEMLSGQEFAQGKDPDDEISEGKAKKKALLILALKKKRPKSEDDEEEDEE